jgi:membrane protein DedA with SNARE-associated domain
MYGILRDMSFLQQVLGFLSFSRYAVVFVLCIVEGPVVMITSGFLYRLGQFSLLPLYFSMVGGDFVADLGWYAVGRFGAWPLIDRYGKYFNITPKIILRVEKRFKTYQNKILFISKITMGFGFALATLIVAGLLRVDFKKYALLNFLGGFIWTAFLIAIGYFFGNVYDVLAGPFKIIFVCFLVVGIIFGLRAINQYLIKKEI